MLFDENFSKICFFYEIISKICFFTRIFFQKFAFYKEIFKNSSRAYFLFVEDESAAKCQQWM